MNETLQLFLIIGVISIIVIIVANIELFITKRKTIFSGPLTKNFVVIKPKYTGFSEPVWIFNSKNMKAKQIPHSNGFNKNEYDKYVIEEHFASRLNRPLREFFDSLKSIPKSKMPMNTLFNAIYKGEVLASSADPAAVIKPSSYKIIHSKQDNVEAFIAGDNFYLLQK